MSRTLKIKASNFKPCVFWTQQQGSNLSDFDKQFRSAWKDSQSNGYFRYEVNIKESCMVPGKWNFLVELNPERQNQRKPQEFYSVNQPFNPELFNFTRIRKGEVMFRLMLEDTTHVQLSEDEDLLVINVSPINDGHSLLLPYVNRMYPQALTQYSIELGLKILLLSSSPGFRVAFNSLCGSASVNHLHLHCLYVDTPMRLETIDLQHLAGPCYQLINYPGKCFVFQSHAGNEEDMKKLARNVYELTSFLQNKNEAHNVIMTRAQGEQSEEENCMSDVRVFVWVRTPKTGAKETTNFNPAALELFGYFTMKTSDSFKSVDEESLCNILENLTSTPFQRNLEQVRKIFEPS